MYATWLWYACAALKRRGRELNAEAQRVRVLACVGRKLCLSVPALLTESGFEI